MKKRWTIREQEYLKNNYKHHYDALPIAQHLRRSLKSVQNKISKMGIAIPLKTFLSPADEKFLLDNRNRLTNKQLAYALGIPFALLRKKLYRLNLQRYRIKDKQWSPEQDAILISNYKVFGDAAIVKLLPGKNKRSVHTRRITLGLIRTLKQVKNIYPRYKYLQQFKARNKRKLNKRRNGYPTRRQLIIHTINKLAELKKYVPELTIQNL